jgi:hypothetical protein
MERTMQQGRPFNVHGADNVEIYLPAWHEMQTTACDEANRLIKAFPEQPALMVSRALLVDKFCSQRIPCDQNHFRARELTSLSENVGQIADMRDSLNLRRCRPR